MRPLCLTAALFLLPLHAAESPRVFPLWDGKEPIESYARRVNLPPTKQLDLGNGVTLDLVLIPAGQFIMGTPEPAKPLVGETESMLLAIAGAFVFCLVVLLKTWTSLPGERFTYSLRWLMAIVAACALFIGGIARTHMAREQMKRYDDAMKIYNALPSNEKPGHAVTLTQPFYMGKYAVTQVQYKALIAEFGDPSHFKGAQLPVESVGWFQATAFCAMLNERLNDKTLEVCLPTEAQWEFACRAGTQTRFYSGDQESDLDAVAWHRGNSGGTTHPVGTKRPNAFGLYDMHGNVWQLCRDAYMENINELPAIDPFNEIERGAERVSPEFVLRGGCWDYNPRDCSSSYRHSYTSGNYYSYGGFRVAAMVASSKSP